jgi:predicted dithiol-disulfide oxidoreductase (DUF899 family)
MNLPQVVSQDEWLAARKELLAKELTRQRDALNTERRTLPMVRIEKEYEWWRLHDEYEDATGTTA